MTHFAPARITNVYKGHRLVRTSIDFDRCEKRNRLPYNEHTFFRAVGAIRNVSGSDEIRLTYDFSLRQGFYDVPVGRCGVLVRQDHRGMHYYLIGTFYIMIRLCAGEMNPFAFCWRYATDSGFRLWCNRTVREMIWAQLPTEWIDAVR
jgi:hypothetical protein